MATLDAQAIINEAVANAQRLQTLQNAPADVQRGAVAAVEDRDLFASEFGRRTFGEGNALEGANLAVSEAQAERRAQNPVPFGEFVQGPDFDFLGLESGLNQRLGQGVAQGEQQALGSLARRGLLGSGAEAGVNLQAGERLGQGAVDIRRSLQLKQLDFDTLKANRETMFNQAKSMFEQGQTEAAERLLFQFEALTAELNSRKQEGGGLGSVIGTVGGAILGGPIGASIGSSIFGGGGGGSGSASDIASDIENLPPLPVQ